MSLTVKHNTPADGTFSASGAIAWNANHTLTGQVDLTTDVTGVLPAANGGAATLVSTELVYGNGTATPAQDANLTWDATTGLLTKKGVSSPTTGKTGSEAFGSGAVASIYSTVIGNNASDTSTGYSVLAGSNISNSGAASVILGANINNTGDNNFILGSVISNPGANNAILGSYLDAANATFSTIQGFYNSILHAGATSVSIFGGYNSLDNIVGAGASGNQAIIFGNGIVAAPATINGLVGSLGAANYVSHEGCFAVGAFVTSKYAYEFAWGGGGIAGTTNPVSLRLSGAQTGTESDMTRINCTWSGANSIVTYSAYLGATEQVGVKIEAKTNGAVTTIGSGFIVANLPAGTVGQRAWVTNALAPVWGSTVVGGGAITVPVFYNGTWIVG